MELFTAQQAQALSNFAQTNNIALIQYYLSKVKEAAAAGKYEYIHDTVGAGTDLVALHAGLTALGYQMHEIGGQQTPGGSSYQQQAIKITW